MVHAPQQLAWRYRLRIQAYGDPWPNKDDLQRYSIVLFSPPALHGCWVDHFLPPAGGWPLIPPGDLTRPLGSDKTHRRLIAAWSPHRILGHSAGTFRGAHLPRRRQIPPVPPGRRRSLPLAGRAVTGAGFTQPDVGGRARQSQRGQLAPAILSYFACSCLQISPLGSRPESLTRCRTGAWEGGQTRRTIRQPSEPRALAADPTILGNNRPFPGEMPSGAVIKLCPAPQASPTSLP